VEPFVGAGAVFLNVDTEQAILNDINPDLINLYQLLKTEGKTFIDYAAQFFTPQNNQEKKYYQLRETSTKVRIFYYAVHYFYI